MSFNLQFKDFLFCLYTALQIFFLKFIDRQNGKIPNAPRPQVNNLPMWNIALVALFTASGRTRNVTFIEYLEGFTLNLRLIPFLLKVDLLIYQLITIFDWSLLKTDSFYSKI